MREIKDWCDLYYLWKFRGNENEMLFFFFFFRLEQNHLLMVNSHWFIPQHTVIEWNKVTCPPYRSAVLVIPDGNYNKDFGIYYKNLVHKIKFVVRKQILWSIYKKMQSSDKIWICPVWQRSITYSLKYCRLLIKHNRFKAIKCRNQI